MSNENARIAAERQNNAEESLQRHAEALGSRLLRRLKIGAKLNLGFGVLLLLTIVVIVLSFFASERASTNMTVTTDLRAPSTLASSRAQASLLKMVADVRGIGMMAGIEVHPDGAPGRRGGELWPRLGG